MQIFSKVKEEKSKPWIVAKKDKKDADNIVEINGNTDITFAK